MSGHGFIYLLSNDCMPGMYKIGMTEQSPHKRCAELSAVSGIAVPFNLICYAAVTNARSAEASLHRILSEFRVSKNREFFGVELPIAVGAVFHHCDRLDFCDVDAVPTLYSKYQWEHRLEYLPNPWMFSPGEVAAGFALAMESLATRRAGK